MDIDMDIDMEMEIEMENHEMFNALGFVKWKHKEGDKTRFGVEVYAMYDRDAFNQSIHR
jgi:hypothetical protein